MTLFPVYNPVLHSLRQNAEGRRQSLVMIMLGFIVLHFVVVCGLSEIVFFSMSIKYYTPGLLWTVTESLRHDEAQALSSLGSVSSLLPSASWCSERRTEL